jgi:hypothetical protein
MFLVFQAIAVVPNGPLDSVEQIMNIVCIQQHAEPLPGTKRDSSGSADNQRDGLMIAALATLAFLVAIWAVVVALAETLVESGEKIMAALKGQSPLAIPVRQAPVRVRVSARSVRQARPVRARPKLRAAA